MPKVEQFSNRWGIVLASLGMAIGAGNLWRFPRLAGQYGGTFIILWVLFLLIWSVPLLMAEFAIGKKFKKGVVGSLGMFAGKGWTWMGFFVTICTLGIAFYYSVVTAWALRYLFFSFEHIGAFSSEVLTPDILHGHWQGVSNQGVLTVITYVLVIILSALILLRGVRRGLEKANKILIPSLFVLLFVIIVVSLSLPGGISGLEYMFKIDARLFGDPVVWIEALSQSAWSTGAGWGLLMTLSSYSRQEDDIALNTFIGAFGNNTASLLAGMAIIPAVFATSISSEIALQNLQAGNQALTFTVIPQLFATIKGGVWLSIIFFLALSLAAFTSFLSMMEMFIRNLRDLNMERSRIIWVAIIVFSVFGFPSAYYLDFFNNQDWVWGLGLIVSGLFILFAVVKHGAGLFKDELIQPFSDIIFSVNYFKLSVWFSLICAPLLIYWWLSRGYSEYPWFNEMGFWNFVDVYSNASVLTQWVAVILVGMALNRFLVKKFVD